MRRWSRQPYTFSQDPKLDVPDSSTDVSDPNQHFPELPMPKDSHLLSPMSRALLRAARAGCIYIRHVNREAEEDDRETADAGESAPTTRAERSFTARKWTAIPKHMEPPEVEFLAKRRPGLPSLYGASGTLNAGPNNNRPPMRKTKIKKVDPTTGEESVYEVWVPEGHTVEGEIKDDAEAPSEQKEATATTETTAPGTVAEGVGVANADGAVAADASTVESPSKRRGPPPPKRKGKGAGKGRRKRVMFAPGEGADAAVVHGADGAGDERMAVDGEQFEDEDEEDEEEEEGEEGDGGTKEDAALEAKSPGTTLPESSTTPVTEQGAAPVEPSAENQPASDQQPSDAALPEKPSSEAPQAPQELPVPNGTEVVSSENAAGTENQESRQELQQSKPSPPVSAPPTIEPSPVGTTTNAEAPESAPDSVQNTGPVAEPAPDAMEGVEQTNTTESVAVPEQAPALEKTEVPGVVEQKTTGNQEAVEAGDALSQPAAPLPTAEVASAVVSEAISQPVPGAGAEGSVDLLGTLEASLGEEKVNVSSEQGTTGSASAEQDQPETTAVPPESASAAPPAPAPAVSEELKAEAEASEQPQPEPGPVPEPETKEGAVKDEPEA